MKIIFKRTTFEKLIFIINVLRIFGKSHIHKQKLANNKPNITLFKIEMENYIKLLQDVRNMKAKRTIDICKCNNIFC